MGFEALPVAWKAYVATIEHEAMREQGSRSLFDPPPLADARASEADRKAREGITKSVAKEGNAARLRIARTIARRIALNVGTVMTWQVERCFRHEVISTAWEDADGKTYWAGAIFRTGEWERVRYEASPDSHHRFLGVWKLREES